MNEIISFESRDVCILCSSKESLHVFPNESVNEWCHILKIHIKDYKPQMRICSLHFHESFVANKKLRLGAKPLVAVERGNIEVFKIKGSRRCCIRSCGKSTADNVSIFNFPRDERRTTWESFTNTEGFTKPKFICETHFEKKFFLRANRLSRNALPTIFITNSPTDMVQLPDEVGTQEAEVGVYFPNAATDVPANQGNSQKLINEENVENLETKSCRVPFCFNYNLDILYPFPDDPFRLQIWCNLCGLNYERNKMYICQAHFKVDCITPTGLKSNSIPTLFPIPSLIHWDLEDRDKIMDMQGMLFALFGNFYHYFLNNSEHPVRRK